MGLEEGYVGKYAEARMIGCLCLYTWHVAHASRVYMTGNISSTVIGIKVDSWHVRQHVSERYQPVAQADSKVGSVPVAAVRRVPPPLNITPLTGGAIGGSGKVDPAGQSVLTEGL